VWIKKALPESYDKFDFEAHIDKSLSYNENRRILEEKIKPLLKPENQLTRADIKNIEDIEQREREKRVEQTIKEWKESKALKIVESDKTEILKSYIDMTCKGFNNFLIVTGRQGLGKTYVTINILKEINNDFQYKSGYITPLSLYCYLYKHRNELIVFDDLDGLFDKKCVAILKSALWDTNGKRLVSYETTSEKIKDTPEMFEFKGKIIILTNELIGKNDISFQALLSRAITYPLKMAFDEILQISNNIIENSSLFVEQKILVNEIIKRNVTEISNFNFRILDRLIQMVKYNKDKAEYLFQQALQEDKEMELVLRLMKSEIPIKEQIDEFIANTGKSRATYFRIKEKIKELVSKSHQKDICPDY